MISLGSQETEEAKNVRNTALWDAKRERKKKGKERKRERESMSGIPKDPKTVLGGRNGQGKWSVDCVYLRECAGGDRTQ